MHNAPPVVFPVGRFVLGLRMWLTLVIAGGAALTAWLWHVQPDHGRWLGAVLVTVVLGGASWWCLRRESASRGELVWDGERWSWCPLDGQACVVDVSVWLDRGAAMGLQWRAHGELLSQFAWVSADAMPGFWHGFRCAVYSRRGNAASTGQRGS